ncbi:hypothetical protein MAJ_07526, partial [Metarhizium majus ARSEF 297]
MASAHHRHQSSLEGFIGFSSSPPLETDERALAAERFFDIIEHYENNKPLNAQYNRPKLLRLTYEYATSEKSKDNILQAFFNAVSLPMNQENDIDFSIKETEELILAKLSGKSINKKNSPAITGVPFSHSKHASRRTLFYRNGSSTENPAR